MKRRRSSALTWAAMVALGLSASCAPRGVLEVRGAAMGTTYSVKFVGRAADRETVLRAVEAELAAVDAAYSTYLDDSVVSRFNASRDIDAVHQVGEEFVALVQLAVQVAEATGGAFDPTVMPLVKAYPLRGDGRQATSRPEFPDADAVAAAVAKVGYRDIEIVAPDRMRKRSPDVELDTNGFAKGHGVDRLAERLRQLGHRDFLVEIGGEVRCGGRKPDGSSWRVGVERPTADGSRAVGEAIEVRDAAIATSGGYRQFVETAGGERVHHIFDPATGANPRVRVVSVSVRAPTCALADALATAFMVTGPERAQETLSALRPTYGEDLGALFMMANSSVPDRVRAATQPAAESYRRVVVSW